MYPAKPDVKEVKKGSGFGRISMLPVELLKKQETLRTVAVK